MWKLLTYVIAYHIYGHLDEQKMLPEEHRGCRESYRETNDLLCIDRAVILCAGNSELGGVDIKRGIFKGILYLF